MLRVLRIYPNASALMSLARRKGDTTTSPHLRLFSYLHCASETSLRYKTLGDLLDETAEKFGDRTAYVSVYQNKKITFKETKHQAEVLAEGILSFGLEKGDRVALLAVNSIEWYLTSMALAKAGVVAVYLNPGYQAMELEHCLNAVGVKMLIAGDSYRGQSYLPMFDEVMPELRESIPGNLKCSKVPSLRTVVWISDEQYPGTIPFRCIADKSTEASKKKLQKVKQFLKSDDASFIKFTSGTTGKPKGVVLSHFNIVNNSFFVSKRQQFQLKEHIMCFMGPLFHAMGSVIGILTCLHEGITLVVPDVAFSRSKCAQAIVSEKCTIILGTPTMYVDIINEMQSKGIKASTLELAMTGGSLASASLFKDISATLGVKRVASIYGLTETGPISFMSLPTDNLELTSTTVGQVLDYTEAKVVDKDGNILPWNTPGELWIRGYLIMKGYWDDDQRTKEAITPEHWFKTGDQFILRKDGYGKIVGRIKEIIIRGGENIFPEDLENLLATHPDIKEAQVIGVPDQRLGEQICACIRLKPNSKLTENEVKDYCKEKVAQSLVPYYVMFLEEFPKTASGKVQKFELRNMAVLHFRIE